MGELGRQRVLVVEDDPFVALELENLLTDHGFEVVGPTSSIAAAQSALAAGSVHGALLDVNIKGELVFPVADALAAAGVPFVLLSGYTADTLPPAYRDRPFIGKPYGGKELMALLQQAMQSPDTAKPARGRRRAAAS